MTEWLILSLLVPAIVVPVVLLVGFAGCDIVYGLERPPVASINTAEGTSGTAITLTWTFDGDPVTGFEFERMKLPERTRDTVTAGSSKPYRYVDNDSGRGLVPGTTYLYRIRAVLRDGTDLAWSNPEPNVLATTLPFQTIFEWTGDEKGRSQDAPGWQGNCLVQRIEPVRLSDISSSG